MRALERLRLRRAVKEAMDDLPAGICFFNREGLPVLCNHRMHDLVFRMTGRDLQTLSELEQALDAAGTRDRDGCFTCPLPGGEAWRFSLRTVTAEGPYTQAIAFDVTALCAEQERLRQANQAQRRTLEALEALQRNVVAVTREEEVLAMKMRLHNDLGYGLQMIRRHMEQGFQPGEKERFIARQREALSRLRVREEKGGQPVEELIALAESLDMGVDLTGDPPDDPGVRALLPLILRECLINTARHAHGDRLYVRLSREKGGLGLELTNNGLPPTGPVQEGGGLSSLRARIQGAGGTMAVDSAPVFRLRAFLPIPEDQKEELS